MRRGSLACVETLRGKYTLPKGSASESPEAGAWICGTWPAPANGPMRQLPRTGRRKRVFRIAAGIPKGLEGPLGGQGGAEPRAAPMVPQSRLARQPPVRTGRAVAERRETADVTLSPLSQSKPTYGHHVGAIMCYRRLGRGVASRQFEFGTKTAPNRAQRLLTPFLLRRVARQEKSAARTGSNSRYNTSLCPLTCAYYP